MAEAADDKIPRRARELFDKGLVAVERKNYDYAIDMFLAALEMAPSFMQARKFLRAASINAFNETHSSAISHKIAHVISTLAGLGDLFKGRKALRAGQALDALQLSDRVLRKDPFNLPFVRLQCAAAEKAGMPEIAIHTLQTVREYYPENTELVSSMGDILKNANRLEEARECFEHVVQAKPTDMAAVKALKDILALESMKNSGMGEAAEKGGSFRDRLRDAAEASRLEAANRRVKAESDLEALIRDAVSKVQQEPENVNHRRALATLYEQANHLEDAVYALTEIRRVSGMNDPQVDQNILSIRLKQFDREIAMLVENGDKPGADRKRAEKEEFRLKEIRAQVERYPNDLQLKFVCGEALLAIGQHDEAIRLFQQSMRIPKNRVRSLYSLAVCFKEKGQADMAVEQLLKAEGEVPNMNEMRKEILYLLGTLLDQAGRSAEAMARFKEIYQADINFKDVAEKINQSYKRGPAPDAPA